MGAKYPLYSWRQDTSHVFLRVPVPRGTRAADIVVKLQKQHLYIALANGQVLINSKTASPIKVDDMEIQWELEPVHDPYLVIHLIKFFRKEAMNCRDASETWWSRCLRETKEPAPKLKAAPHCYYSSMGHYDRRGEL